MNTDNSSIERIRKARSTKDGEGVEIKRLSGFSKSGNMDPFLMLDEINCQDEEGFIGGFPPHPHRGIETITYMRKGGFSHTDSMGNTGAVLAGGAQWMTAARGVIHSEMPVSEEAEIHGFQFWLNLPKAEKMGEPAYWDINPQAITLLEQDNATLRLIAGELALDEVSLVGPVMGKTTSPVIADVELRAGAVVKLQFAANHKHGIYVYEGEVLAGNTTINTHELAFLSSIDTITVSASDRAGLMFFGGKPLNEPVVHYGPFVMNTQEEIDDAVKAYQEGTFIT